MQAESDGSGLARQYARQTRRRMALAIRELNTMNQAGLGDTLCLSGWIEAQEKASRAAGFVRIARLCETMNECLAGLRRGETPVLVPLVGSLLEVCRIVELHAETVAKPLRSADRAPSPRRVRKRSDEGSKSPSGAPIPFIVQDAPPAGIAEVSLRKTLT